MTERTITIEFEPGRWINIPTIYGGRVYHPDDAIELARKFRWLDPDTQRAMPTFGSLKDAEAAAQARSKALGEELKAMGLE